MTCALASMSMKHLQFTIAYLEFGLLSTARCFGSRSDVSRQVGHPSRLLYEVVEGAKAAQLHHYGQLHP